VIDTSIFHALGDMVHALIASPHLRTYLTIGWIGYLVWLGGWIVLQKREPAATLSWLISLAALPFVGFAIYYVFGPQRIRRQRVRRARNRGGLPTVPAGHAPGAESAELALPAQASRGLPANRAPRLDLLFDGAATFDALHGAIAEAREHVHLEYYIYQPDRTGIALRDALVARAQAGVQVRVLLDAVGSSSCSRRFFAPLIAAGGEVAWFHPIRWFNVWRRPWLNLRTHRKIAVIDGRIGFTGGVNITDAQDERLRGDAYRDLHMHLEGEIVQVLQLVFVEDWAYSTRTPPLPLGPPVPQRGAVAAQVVASGPDSPWEAIHRLHVGAIHAAQRRVWLTTPYFVPGEAAMMALTSAALGGLDVRLLVPRMCDSRLVTYAARSYFDELLGAGVRIYEYGPRLLHTKALLCDDDLAIIGSANFDHRSFRLNFEVSVLLRDEAVAATLARHLESECSRAPRVRNDRAQPLWRARLPEALARLVSPLL